MSNPGKRPSRSDRRRPLTSSELDALRQADSLRSAPDVSRSASAATRRKLTQLRSDALTLTETAELLGCSPAQVLARLKQHTLLGVLRDGQPAVAAFQFDDDGELPGWEQIMAAFPEDVNLLSVAHFLETEHYELQVVGELKSPRAWLRSGRDPQQVVTLAGMLHDLP